jgi:hypothetical protein
VNNDSQDNIEAVIKEVTGNPSKAISMKTDVVYWAMVESQEIINVVAGTGQGGDDQSGTMLKKIL